MDSPALNGSNIRKLRKILGVSQREFAMMLNVQDASMSRWENGRGFPTSTTKLVIINLFVTHGIVSAEDFWLEVALWKKFTDVILADQPTA